MGTPDIAVPCLDATVAWAEHVRVVTQPDRPRGRSGAPSPSPVKTRALELGLEVVQPERLRDDATFVEWMSRESVAVAVVVAFGQILPAPVLAVPRLGCVNVHFSRLPAWRGAAPVQWSLLAGDRDTAVTCMLMDEGLDTGPILRVEPVVIDDGENAGELLARMAALAPKVLRQALEEVASGSIIPTPQDSRGATTARRLSKEDGQLDWTEPATAVVQRVRGTTPWPGAWGELAGEQVKVLRARLGEGRGQPGAILAIAADWGVLVATGDGAVWLGEVQAPGRRPMRAELYAHGRRLLADGA